MTICLVKGCISKSIGKGYCRNHYMQIRRNGKISFITKYTPNQIIIKNTHAEIVLRNNKYEIVGKALIDLEDIDKCKKYKWCMSKDGYVKTISNNKMKLLHRFLLNPKENEIIDHKNQTKLDCQKYNLRIVSKSLNTFNCKVRKDNTSGVVGVSKSRNKWRARININSKEINLGHLKDLDEAVKIRKEAELKYFGENPMRSCFV